MSTKSEINISTIWDIFKVEIVPEAPGEKLISKSSGGRMKRGRKFFSHFSGGEQEGVATDFLFHFKWEKTYAGGYGLMLYISGTVYHIIQILIMVSTGVFLYFFKKYNIVNIKIILFLLAHLNSFFNDYLFFKFINKCQKEIMRCAPPSLRVCVIF